MDSTIVVRVNGNGFRRDTRLHRAAAARDEIKALQAVPSAAAQTAHLRPAGTLDLGAVFRCRQTQASWEEARARLDQAGLSNDSGGLNPGDRRALFYLVHKLQPSSVLEIGTHLGTSTSHMALAMALAPASTSGPHQLTTVDIRDVNNPRARPCRSFRRRRSPRAIIDRLGCSAFVRFVTDDSVNYLQQCRNRFDLIFLDGDHAATSVYREIPLALKVLNPGGVIVLHDYFPRMEPLWRNGVVIPGPYIATQRLIAEGAKIQVEPLQKLPWPTKLNSSVTSLAMVWRQALTA